MENVNHFETDKEDAYDKAKRNHFWDDEHYDDLDEYYEDRYDAIMNDW